MLLPGDQNRLKLGKWLGIIITIVVAVPFLLIGIGFIVGGLLVDPNEMTSDGFKVQYFLFGMGGLFIVLTFSSIPFVVGFVWVFKYLQKGLVQKEQMLEDLKVRGKEGKAVVLELQDTGMLINYNPQVTLVLEISFDNQSPYQISKTETIPLVRLPQVQVGETIDVLIDPDDFQNPDKVFLMLK